MLAAISGSTHAAETCTPSEQSGRQGDAVCHGEAGEHTPPIAPAGGRHKHRDQKGQMVPSQQNVLDAQQRVIDQHLQGGLKQTMGVVPWRQHHGLGVFTTGDLEGELALARCRAKKINRQMQ